MSRRSGTGVIYAGIGSRTTPPEVLKKMEAAGRAMAVLGFTLRSGGAEGADEAFERGCDLRNGAKEIYLPWQHFRKNPSPLFGSTKEARAIAKQYHPNWEVLGDRARDFMGRNSFQILGRDLQTPVTFVLCWTPGGKTIGGTGQALRIAEDRGIPIINFATHTDDEISDFIFAQEEIHG